MSTSQQLLETPELDPRLSRYRFVMGGLLVLLNFSLGLSFFVVTPITPIIMDEFEINRSMASLLTSVVILAQASLAIPSGIIISRVGVKRMVLIGWAMASVTMLTWMATSFPLLLAVRIIYGISFAMLLPATGPIMMQWFRPKELPILNAINASVVTMSISISTFTIAPLSELLEWQMAVSLYGGASLLGAILWAALARTGRRASSETARHPSFREIWSVLKSRTALLLALADAGPFAQYTALVAWLPTYYFEVYGMSLSRAGSLVGLLPLAGIFSVVLAGVLAFKVSSRRLFLLIPGLLVALGGFGSFLLGDGPLLYAALLVVGFASWFYLPVLFTIPLELPEASEARVALTYGTMMTIASFFAFLSPLFVGTSTDILGTYKVGFAVLALLALTLLAGGIVLPETGSGREPAAKSGPS